ncbi:substrate-binding domain-containing protein [Oscillospiraceae bacterium PP1C4]
MRKALSLALACALALGTIGCGAKPAETSSTAPASEAPAASGTVSASETTTAPAKDIVIAGIYKAGDQQWFIGEGDAAKAKCLEMGAKDFMYIDAKMNPDTYLQALDNAITQGVSGILVCVPDQKLSAITVQKCKEAGIPVIAADDQLLDESGKMIAPWVGIDGKAIGVAVGEWTANYAKENKMTGDDAAVLYLTMDQVSSCVPRTEGQIESWGKVFPDWAAERTFKSDYNGEQDKAYNAAAGIFTANPQIKKWIVMTPNDEGAAGATRALEAAGLDKDAVVCGIGGYLAKLEFAKAEPSAFKATAFINYVDVGAYSAENMMNYLVAGVEIPKEFKTPAVMITKDNYVEIMKDQAK